MKAFIFIYLLSIVLYAENALVDEDSPYLQQHAHNPVNWYPYNDETFALAKKEHKPIFLSIGYSTCHWCHVMAQESFEDETIAKLLNNDYIAIKVDREEMPHIDTYYQQMFSKVKKRSGGWPLNLFLDENGETFYIATYIPPSYMYNHEGMDTLLPRLGNTYKNHKDKIRKKRDAIYFLLNQKTSSSSKQTLDTQAIFSSLEKQYDFIYYGFRRLPKFPEASKIDLLFTLDKLGYSKAKEMALNVLDAMALKGIYDSIDGGFFRYSTDGGWEIPHFEKMLYNQAELIPLYIKAHRLNPKTLYHDIVNETISMVDLHFNKEELFLSASDADSNHHEGGYFIFSNAEIQDALKNNPHKDSISDAYDLDFLPNFESHYHLINSSIERPEGFYDFKEKLKKVRETREYPFIDTKIITSWNAMMIEALYKASYFDKKYIQKAKLHLKKLLEHHYKKEILYHQSILGKTATQEALLEDYSFLVSALITAYETTYDTYKLNLATKLMDKSLQKFYKKNIWYLNTSGLLIEADLQDKHYTSALGKNLQNLYKLSALSENPHYAAIATQTLKSLHVKIQNSLVNTPASNIALLMQEYGVISLKHSKKILNQYREKINTLNYPFIVTKTDNSGLFLACEETSCFAYSKEFKSISNKIEKRLDKIP